MKLIIIENFKGRIPRVDPEYLPTSCGQVATNCNTDTGALAAYKGTTTVNTPSKVGVKKTIYKWGGLYWFHWITDVNICRGPIAGDTAERVYITGDGVPKVTDSSIAVSGGGTNYPTNCYTLGVPAPTNTPSVAIVGGSVDPTTAESRSYVYTYVSVFGEESAPSPVSAIVSPEPTQSVNVTNLGGVPSGAYNMAYKRIYRTVTGVSGTSFRYVGQIPAANDSFSDTIPTSTVGNNEELLSTDWDVPPTGMQGIVNHPSGFLVGFSGNELCISVQYVPSAWPGAFRLTMDYPIVAVGIFGTSILVTTTGTTYLVSGTTPGELVQEKVDINQSCVSKRGLVDIGEAIAYPSPDGLIVVGNSIMKNATSALMTREDWQALVPSSILGVFHDGKYFGFYDTGAVQAGFIYDPQSEDWKDLSLYATAAWSDPITDTLYLQVGDNIVSFGTGANLSYTWRSKVFALPRPCNPACIRILAHSYPVPFELYADGALKHTGSVASRDPFWLPGGYMAGKLEIKITGAVTITRIEIAESIEELR